MTERLFRLEDATATMIDEMADEVHEFENARQGGIRIRRLLLRKDEVIELELG